MTKKSKIVVINTSEEDCWQTGNYTNNCDCELCTHKHECSGYDKDDEEDEE